MMRALFMCVTARITMGEAACDGGLEKKESPESSLQKCISVLKAAKSDTERFAALLLFGH